jgi:hypothetical protein
MTVGPATRPRRRPPGRISGRSRCWLDVGVDLVDRGVERVGHVRAVGDVGQRLSKTFACTT